MMFFRASVFFAITLSVRAQDLVDQPSLTLDAAIKMVNACESLAKSKNWKVAMWVVDENGVPVHIKRMEGAPARAIHEAEMKSMSSRQWGASTDPADPSSPVAKMLKEPRGQAQAVLLNTLPESGGLPVLVDGKTAGAIGIAGAGGTGDGQCARAAIDALHRK
jgi:glc operon protein GlcG